ncbi:phage major tail protein, TP901-1 family [Enterococcus faecium]|uniref:phage major tail protein, TP901-1 family n=1 Tax=Enterococcus TaxID=1350 RepID=UPI0020911700|nr:MULTISPECIES: phage major tail protein, TP901-1 family [Enterococcus]MCO5478480.1 phage major tail protein, TP901-1 family [Enterococcus gallinarum]MCO5533700.1 phage major tail protein, TP901-1 family [Enterococcus faecium]
MPEKEVVYNKIKKPTGKPLVAKKVWYFLQSVDAKIGSPALLPAFQTEGGVTYGGENIDKQTKMGRIILKSTDEHSIELTQYFVPGDEAIKTVIDAKKTGKSVKVWRVEVDPAIAEKVDAKDYKLYPAQFGYGMPDEPEISDGDELVEASYTLNIIGSLQDGKFPLTDADISAIEALYDYQNPGETTGDFDSIETSGASSPSSEPTEEAEEAG